MKTLLALILVQLLGSGLAADPDHASRITHHASRITYHVPLLPEPREVQRLPGRLDMGPSVQIVLADAQDEEDRFAAETLRGDLRELVGVRVPIVASPGSARARRIIIGQWNHGGIVSEVGQEIGLQPDPELGDQGYVLVVTPKFALVTANEAPGVFYGVQTLRQLLTREGPPGVEGTARRPFPTPPHHDTMTPPHQLRRGRWFFPAVRLRDWPAMRYRGISDDISRGPIPTVEYMKRQIRTFAYFKLNVLSWYMEHPFRYAKHPDFAPPDAVTPEEVREIVAYARRYHVELIPEQQSFGHGWQILRHEQYANLRETPGIFCPVKEETYQFFGDLYAELAQVFPSPLFHVGCDETYGLGEGPSKERAEQIGVGRVYLQHVVRLRDLLQAHGKRILFWGDIALQHPDLLSEIPKDIIVANWGYAGVPSFAGQLQPYADVGLDQFVCPGVSNWSQMFPNLDNALVNIHSFVRDGQQFKAMGMLNTTWDDDGETLFEHTWYGVVYSAACAWQPGAADAGRFGEQFDHAFYGNRLDHVLSRAHWLLGSTHALLGLPQTSDSFFWEDPFASEAALKMRHLPLRAAQLQQVASTVLDLLARSRPAVTREAGNLDYLAFAARRYRWLADKILVADRVARRYRELFAEPFVVSHESGVGLVVSHESGVGLVVSHESGVADGTIVPDYKPDVARELERMEAALRQLRDRLALLKEEYASLWLRECRPDFLPNILPRYDRLMANLEAKAQQLRQARATFEANGILPDPAELGFEEKQLPQRRRRPPKADWPEASQSAWWNEQWHYRVPLLVRNGEEPKGDYPVEVDLNFDSLLKQAGVRGTLDPGSIRVIPCTEGTKGERGDERGKRGYGVSGEEEIPCQFIPGPSQTASRLPRSKIANRKSQIANRVGSVVWMVDGELPPKEVRAYQIYFDTVENGPKPPPPPLAKGGPGGVNPVRTWPDKNGGGFWIENDRCRLLLSPEGGHLYVWEVKALGLDITQPGRSGWAGFNDVGGYRDAPFRWTCLADGPLLVRYRSVGPQGAEMTLNCFAGAGWAEVFLNFLVGYYWDFDAVEHLAADQPQPGTAIFSNGVREPVPASDEQRQVIQPDTTWCAKTRADSLTLGLITPDRSIPHLVGPGGGWGGVGIERGGEASHFVTFGDVCADPAGMMERLRATLSSRTSPELQIGAPQGRPGT